MLNYFGFVRSVFSPKVLLVLKQLPCKNVFVTNLVEKESGGSCPNVERIQLQFDFALKVVLHCLKTIFDLIRDYKTITIQVSFFPFIAL